MMSAQSVAQPFEAASTTIATWLSATKTSPSQKVDWRASSSSWIRFQVFLLRERFSVSGVLSLLAWKSSSSGTTHGQQAYIEERDHGLQSHRARGARKQGLKMPKKFGSSKAQELPIDVEKDVPFGESAHSHDLARCVSVPRQPSWLAN